MKEIRDILEINNEDNLFLINEKIKYFKLTEQGIFDYLLQNHLLKAFL